MLKIGLFSVMAATAALTLSACGGGEEKAPAVEAPAPAAPAPVAAPPVEVPAAEPAVAPAVGAPAAAGATVQLAGLTGDAAAGQRIFAQCRTCHAVEAGQNKVGPSLNGIFGRTAGSVPNFRYSAANKASGVVWTEEVMFEYLENPREFMPGTNMSFVGLKQPQQRVDVIAYLKANT
jgi:cytochrome c